MSFREGARFFGGALTKLGDGGDLYVDQASHCG